jgi:uncharacterized protein YunC (DUF1805 family)
METLTIDGQEHQAIHLPTTSSAVLLIQADQGFLGCGYFSLETADKLGEAVAIVRGVKSFEDMLVAEVQGVSARATELGVTIGDSGREAIKKLGTND